MDIHPKFLVSTVRKIDSGQKKRYCKGLIKSPRDVPPRKIIGIVIKYVKNKTVIPANFFL